MSYNRVKRFYYNSVNRSKYKTNQLVAYKKVDLGFLEVIYWADAFEIYLRPPKKRYGYFLTSFYQLKRAQNFLENYKHIDMTQILPSEFFNK